MSNMRDVPLRGDSVTWLVLHLECMFERRRRSVFDRGSRKEIVGVYLVMKQNRKPSDRSVERMDYERKTDRDRSVERMDSARQTDRETPIIIYPSVDDIEHRGSRNSINRRRSNKSGYEPRYSHTNSRRESARSRSSHPTREIVYHGPELEDKHGEMNELKRAQTYPDYDINREPAPFSHPDIHSWSHDRNSINHDPSSGPVPKFVAFAETAIPPARYPYVQYPAPYSDYPPRSGPQTVYLNSPSLYPGYPRDLD